MLSSDPNIRRIMALRAIESDLLRLRWLTAATRFEIAMRRHDRALKYAYKAGFNPNQPRVPAGQREGGQWAGDGTSSDRVRLAGDLPPLQRMHPDTTYETDRLAGKSLEYWRRQPTEKIIESLKPGEKEALKAYPDGKITNGNTRIKILQERGYDVNSLPRETYVPRSGPRGGGGSFGGGGERFPPRRLLPWQ